MLELKDVIDETVRRRREKWCKRYEKQIKYSQDNQGSSLELSLVKQMLGL